MINNQTHLMECPTLRPSEEEFQNPIAYLSRPDIKQLGYDFGIVKIVPPATWKPYFLLSSDFKFHTRLQKLSDLGITTRSRKFFTENLNRFLKMKRRRPVDLSVLVNGKHVYYYDLFVQVDKLGGYSSLRWDDWVGLNHHFGVEPYSRDLQNEYFVNVKEYAEFLNNNLSNELPQSDSEDEYESCLICGDHDSPTKTLLCDNCDNPYHLKCLGLETVPEGNWYCKKCLVGTGEYGFEEEVERKFSISEFYNHCNQFQQDFFTKYGQLNLEQIEQMFWKFVEEQRSDIEVRYGADIHNLTPGQISGFPMENTPDDIKKHYDSSKFDQYAKHPFNLTNLPYSKGSLLNFINHSISGMTVPWIYVGSLLSTFCWHVEDHYTLSANYCHFGSTKKWYGIPASESAKFEALMRSTAPDLFKRQPDLLHQLVTLMSPSKITSNGIKVFYANQSANEFVVTYPKVYHAGFNSGFNINEAVNFTMDMWLEYGENSISDYRLIKKENVFNHFKLMENVLVNFVAKKEDNIDLVKRCLSSYLSFINRTRYHSSLLDPNFKKLELQNSISYENYLNDDRKDEEDEEDLCDICRTHISHIYCIYNNRKHSFNAQLLRDKAPVRHTRILINQLLTPDSSPQEASTEKFDVVKRERTFHAASVLIDITSDQKNIAEIKQGMNPGKSVRKSSRIDKLKKESQVKSKMSIINNNHRMDDLNAKREISICLECATRIREVPEKSQTVINVSLEEMERFVEEIKEMLESR